MAQDWDIKPRATVCHKCSVQFQDGQKCFSVLTYDEQGYGRDDYCEDCKKELVLAQSVVSAWQGVFKMPPPPPEEAVKKETAESLLRKMVEDKDPSKVNVIYILAVMLERKRILVERDVQRHEDGRVTRVYEHRQTGDTLVITEPHLRLDQLEHVQAEVVEMLGGSSGKQDAPGAVPDADAPRQA